MSQNNSVEKQQKLVQLDIKLRYSSSSQEAKILNYIKENPTINNRDSYISMLRAYWYPFAVVSAGTSKCNARLLALTSVYSLIIHINYICEEFNIPKPYENIPLSNYSGAVVEDNLSDTVDVEKVKDKKEDDFEHNLDLTLLDIDYGNL